MRPCARPAAAGWLRRCVVLSVLLAAAAARGQQPLSIQFDNESGLDPADVYVGFQTTVPGFNATNAATNQPLSVIYSGTTTGNWYPLSSLPSGINVTSITAGLIYVAYGSPWNPEPLNPGYQPSLVDQSNPNYYSRFDTVELTYNGNQADVADLTAINAFSIPMTLNSYSGGAGGTLRGTVAGPSSTAAVVQAVSPLTSPPGGSIVTDANGNFVRVIAPNSYGPSAAQPYDDFGGYLNYLSGTWAPAHGGSIGTIGGHFAGVGAGGSPAIDGQQYQFTASLDANGDLILQGTGSVAGGHELEILHADLVASTGIYGANPAYILDPGTPGEQHFGGTTNDLYGWVIGDALAGMNLGTLGSTALINYLGNPTAVGDVPSQDWFSSDFNTQTGGYFEHLQPGDPFYNEYAAAMSGLSAIYNFPYSDRFGAVTVPLNPLAPQNVDTLQIVLLPAAVPEPSTWVLAALGVAALGLVSRARSVHGGPRRLCHVRAKRAR